MPASAIQRLPIGRRNELMQKISANATRLRGSRLMGTAGTILTHVGRTDALEQLTTRLGVIPIVALASPTSLTANLQAFPGDRGETISVAGGTAAAVFTPPNPPMVATAFTAGGNAQVLTATDSYDGAAQGRALIDILP
jgi:hypothetical protein